MNKRVIIESIKAFTFGAVIGFIVKYFMKTDSYLAPFVFGLIALSFHSKNNSLGKNKNTK